MSSIGSIGNSIQAVNLTNQPLSNIADQMDAAAAASVSGASGLSKSDKVLPTISTGEIPAVKVGLVGKISNSTSYVAKSTINATKDFGNVIANDVLPKPEPLSATILRNKFLSAVLVGGFVNGIQSMVKVATGEYTREEAGSKIMKDTAMGAVSGLSFASGMGLTATVLGGVMGGVPLSIAALTVGTLASMGVTELVKDYVPLFQDKPATTTPAAK